MKILSKPEFLKFLKIISLNLTQAEIKHEIPFCHIDKVEWNYINIIIPDIITTSDLIKILNVGDFKEKHGIIYTKIDDFDIRFIKSNDNLWQYNFYYYSWDFLHVFIDILCDTYSMSFTRNGLIYKHGDKKIDITKNFKDVFEFFDLPFHFIINGFTSEYSIFNFIQSANMFSSDLFTLDNIKKYDYYFEHNKQYYDLFIENMSNDSADKKTIEERLALIDAFFPKSNFIEKLTKIQLKEENKNINFKINKKSVEKQIVEEKKKKKINLGKYFNFDTSKSKPGGSFDNDGTPNSDYTLED
jgi:hypothetical protein